MPTNSPSTLKTGTDDEISLLDSRIQYERILIPHDGTEIVILHVLEHTDDLGKRREELALTMEEGMRQMLEERIRLCKKAGVREVSYIIRAGRPADEIVGVVGEKYYDLIVMASSRISSTIRIILGSNAKRVLDSVPKPILVIR